MINRDNNTNNNTNNSNNNTNINNSNNNTNTNNSNNNANNNTNNNTNNSNNNNQDICNDNEFNYDKNGLKFQRGHEVIINWPVSDDVYLDTMEIADDKRPCVRCGQMPSSEGYDSCIGYVEGADYVCCGHGKEPGIIMLKNGRNLILVDDEKDKRVKSIHIEYLED
jgi:hypothetical protein